jgi:cell wall-associated NlpC family hydrolase
MIRAADLVQYAMQCVGGGYIWGSSGEKCSKAQRERWASWAPVNQASNILVKGAKWDGKYVWDCSGIARGAWRALASYKSGGATGIYNEWCNRKGPIETMPDEPGTFVFRGTDKTKEHIGVYVGDGMVVDARGTDYGVLYGTLKSYKAGWTHWGQADDVDFSATTPTETIPVAVLWTGKIKTRTGSGISLWTDNSKRVAVCKVPDGASVDVLEDRDEKGFALCRYNGYTGMADTQYVYPPDGETVQGVIYKARIEGVKESLNLRTSPEKTTNTILFIPLGATVEVFEGAGTGSFAFVRYADKTGYCTASYLKRLPDEAA